MKLEIKQQWLDALRSGEYMQGHSSLGSSDSRYPEQQLKFCCLGVLEDIWAVAHGKTWQIYQPEHEKKPFIYYANKDNEAECLGYCSPEVTTWAGLPRTNPLMEYHGEETSLSHLNDIHKLSFNEIADLIEEQL